VYEKQLKVRVTLLVTLTLSLSITFHLECYD
jgi:hypothetical protein